MPRILAVPLAGAFLLSAGVVTTAQSARDLQVPTAALPMLELPRDDALPLAMARAIRILYSVPHNDAPLPQMVNLEHLLADIDRLETEVTRAGTRGMSLAMAKTNTERTVLKGALSAVGLKLREQRKPARRSLGEVGTFTVELDSSKDAATLRARLQKIGIDAASLPKRFNAGESIVIAPSVTTLPLPLTAEIWSSMVFERSVADKMLFGTIIRDRRASLLYYGLQSMTPSTLAFVAKSPDLLRHFRDNAGPVAAFGGSFQLDDSGRVVVPGGAEAVDLWQALVDEPVTKADRFGRALFSRDAGRLAYFFDTIGRLDDPHRRFALGLWIKDGGVRLDRLRALYRTFAIVDDKLSFNDMPFLRPPYDPATLLAIVAVTSSGSPANPASRKLWARASEGDDIPDADSRDLREPEGDGTIDAAWLAEQLVSQQQRRQFIDRLAFGQRVFAGVASSDLQDVLVALRGFTRFPAAMLALERIGIREPKVYATAARRARSIEQIDNPAESVPLLAQFQGGLALLERLARTGAVGREELERLTMALVDLEITDHRYEGRVGQWVKDRLLPALRTTDGNHGSEDRLLAAISEHTGSTESFVWEGETYVVDDAAALRDVKAVRKKQGGNTLDVLLPAVAPAYAIAHESKTVDEIKKRTTELNAAASALAPPRAWPDVPDAPDSKKVIERVVRNLGRITKPQDAKKAEQETVPMLDLLDYLLGETLVALAYAPVMGDPAALLGPTADVSHRHTFGVAEKAGSSDLAKRTAWRRPTPGSRAIAGDAVTGSLFGIDIALAPKRLRRIASNRLPGPPKLNGNDMETFATTVALLNPRQLSGTTLRAIGAAVERGRARVKAAASDAPARDALAASASMSHIRRQLLAWTADHAPAQLEHLFSPSEMFWLGTDTAIDRDAMTAWGMSFEAMTGCLCLRLAPAGAWDAVAGRPSTSQLAWAASDVNIRVAGLLSEAGVPAALFPGVMGMAMQDYLDTLPAVYDDDWQAISAHAWAITRERIEDYVSALVVNGPVRVATSSASK
jgi:hypothetical protein